MTTAPGLLPGWSELGLFVAATFVLNATPGVDLLLTVTRTLQGGARAGVAAAVGVNLGCVVHGLAAAAGLAALLAMSPRAFVAIQWAGSAYLLWLAWGMLRAAWRGAPGGTAGATQVSRSAWADLRAGLLTNVLNPKVALFFLAFLPQFIAPNTPHKSMAFLLLGALFVLQSSLFLLLVVVAVARLRRGSTPPAARCALQAAGGGLFAALAIKLMASAPPA